MSARDFMDVKVPKPLMYSLILLGISGLVGFAVTTVKAHGQSLGNLEVRMSVGEKDRESIKTEFRARLERIEDKIDRILERP
jgi:hypothetical protein